MTNIKNYTSYWEGTKQDSLEKLFLKQYDQVKIKSYIKLSLVQSTIKVKMYSN